MHSCTHLLGRLGRQALGKSGPFLCNLAGIGGAGVDSGGCSGGGGVDVGGAGGGVVVQEGGQGEAAGRLQAA